MLRYGPAAVRRLFEASSECGSRQYERADKTPLIGAWKTRSGRGGVRLHETGARNNAPRVPNSVSATIPSFSRTSGIGSKGNPFPASVRLQVADYAAGEAAIFFCT